MWGLESQSRAFRSGLLWQSLGLQVSVRSRRLRSWIDYITGTVAHSSCDSHVGYIVWPRTTGTRKNLGMPSQYLMCLEMAISERIHLQEGKSATNQPCESSNTSLDHCGQEPWVSVVLRGRADVMTARTFPGHVCLAVGCPGQNSRRSGPGWCRRSIGDRRSWLFPLGHTAAQGCWMLPRNTSSHHQGMFCCSPSWDVGSLSHQHAVWGVGMSG